jgi:hypothetical protein
MHHNLSCWDKALALRAMQFTGREGLSSNGQEVRKLAVFSRKAPGPRPVKQEMDKNRSRHALDGVPAR